MKLIEVQNIFNGYADQIGRTLQNVAYIPWSMEDQIAGKEDPQDVLIFVPDKTEFVDLPADSSLPLAIIQAFRIPYEFGIEGYMYYYLTKEQRNHRDELMFNCLFVSMVNPQPELWDTVLNPDLKWKPVTT